MRQRIPTAAWSAAYGSWPMWGFALAAVLRHDAAFAVGATLLGAARAAARLRAVRRNHISVSAEVLHLTETGATVSVPVRNVAGASWDFGFWLPTFDRAGNFGSAAFRTIDGQTLSVDMLVIGTRWGQYRALARLTKQVPVTWLLRWPHSSRDHQTWQPGQRLPRPSLLLWRG